METLRFIWAENQSLVERLSQPFDTVSVEQDRARRPVAVYLHHRSGIVTQICSKMHDIAPRTEIGALEFSTVTGPLRDELAFGLQGKVSGTASIEKLVITEGQTEAESGVVFRYPDHKEIVVVASAAPYVLAVKVPWEAYGLTFDPEYPLEQYLRVPMQ
jgi:hypothetical protein